MINYYKQTMKELWAIITGDDPYQKMVIWGLAKIGIMLAIIILLLIFKF